jgi:hypothetical protein
MTPEQVTREVPYPIAAVYADLDEPSQSLQLKKKALYFTCYQLMRTIALTLAGQYITGEVPQGVVDKLNKSISRIQSPYFSTWIALLRALYKHGPKLGLDFFPEFPEAASEIENAQ